MAVVLVLMVVMMMMMMMVVVVVPPPARALARTRRTARAPRTPTRESECQSASGKPPEETGEWRRSSEDGGEGRESPVKKPKRRAWEEGEGGSGSRSAGGNNRETNGSSA
eukprot:3154401-Pleurochrysis_carterae.AAC.2